MIGMLAPHNPVQVAFESQGCGSVGFPPRTFSSTDGVISLIVVFLMSSLLFFLLPISNLRVVQRFLTEP
jgi:hypothetical protein